MPPARIWSRSQSNIRQRKGRMSLPPKAAFTFDLMEVFNLPGPRIAYGNFGHAWHGELLPSRARRPAVHGLLQTGHANMMLPRAGGTSERSKDMREEKEGAKHHLVDSPSQLLGCESLSDPDPSQSQCLPHTAATHATTPVFALLCRNR
mmetsp:Transcript_37499/g.81460  ORF Transcript_37499/g.81460 Transcript_37499/m.81460 type:complete len:149 (+) Transcript_37499:780-1226(+)